MSKHKQVPPVNHVSRLHKFLSVMCVTGLALIAGLVVMPQVTSATEDRPSAVVCAPGLPANGVQSWCYVQNTAILTLASADADEVKVIKPGQIIACSEHEGQPKNGHPLCDRTQYTFPLTLTPGDCAMVQVDWTANVHNSSDPEFCLPATTTPTPTPTPTPTVPPTSTPTEPSPTVPTDVPSTTPPATPTMPVPTEPTSTPPSPTPPPTTPSQPTPSDDSQQSMECIGGTFVTVLNGEVINVSGTCGDDHVDQPEPPPVIEEGM